MRIVLKFLSCMAVLALVGTGCGGGGDDKGSSSSLSKADQAVVDVLTQSFMQFGNGISQTAAAKVKLAGVITPSYSYGPPPSYLPLTVTLTFTDETSMMQNCVINGSETLTVVSETSFNGSLNIGVVFVNMESDGYMFNGGLAYAGTFSGNPAAGTMTFTCSVTDNGFTVNGAAYDIALDINITVAGATGHGSVSGTINGTPVSEEF